MMNNAKIGLAVVGGYFLGRTKKAKMAIGLGMFLAGRKLRLEPLRLNKMIAGSPVLSGLSDQARDQLVDATKSAASAALAKRINGLADSLHERTLQLDAPSGAADDDRDDPADRNDGQEEGVSGSNSSAADSSPRRKAAKSPRATRSKAGSASATARRTAGKSASDTAASSARRTSSAARRTAAAGRKTASRGTRRTSERGGGDD
ncbi:hypothetical protein [Streptomyces silvisoli]|uniref:DNA primase n=1 Tax=Streptomyces silvisoli TaxID=3034235 RepID=A0ABT5ZJK9_9ACTN|nr:hypothetical protein [Streptomyces silvisoli]MDF3289871.1 hypothetical protein [Streptomyces silvisoli]